MASINENLDDLLDLPPSTVDNDLNTIDITGKNDADFARENIRELILKGNKLFDDISNVAKESENAFAFDSATKLLRSLSILNKDLMEIQKRKKDLLGVGSQKLSHDDANGSNAVIFTGSTAELLRVIRKEK